MTLGLSCHSSLLITCCVPGIWQMWSLQHCVRCSPCQPPCHIPGSEFFLREWGQLLPKSVILELDYVSQWLRFMGLTPNLNPGLGPGPKSLHLQSHPNLLFWCRCSCSKYWETWEKGVRGPRNCRPDFRGPLGASPCSCLWVGAPPITRSLEPCLGLLADPEAVGTACCIVKCIISADNRRWSLTQQEPHLGLWGQQPQPGLPGIPGTGRAYWGKCLTKVFHFPQEPPCPGVAEGGTSHGPQRAGFYCPKVLPCSAYTFRAWVCAGYQLPSQNMLLNSQTTQVPATPRKARRSCQSP